jgi:hypothetical protein
VERRRARFHHRGGRARRRQRLGFQLEEFAEEYRALADEQELVDQLVKVHAAVGRAIRENRKTLQELRSLGDKPRWSLGEEVRVLRDAPARTTRSSSTCATATRAMAASS